MTVVQRVTAVNYTNIATPLGAEEVLHGMVHPGHENGI